MPSVRMKGLDCDPATSASSEYCDVIPEGRLGLDATAMKRRQVIPQWSMKLTQRSGIWAAGMRTAQAAGGAWKGVERAQGRRLFQAQHSLSSSPGMGTLMVELFHWLFDALGWLVVMDA